jgi:hypothetical protein
MEEAKTHSEIYIAPVKKKKKRWFYPEPGINLSASVREQTTR